MATQENVNAVLAKLLTADDDTLYEQLGMRARAVQSQAPGAMQYGVALTHDANVMGPLDDLRTLGKRLLARWNGELYKVFCGSEDADKKDRDSLFNAIGLGEVAIAAAMTGVLVSSFAVAPAVAAVVAALVVKRIGKPAVEVLCEEWKKRLPA
jgi:hypothetical protein